MISITYRNYLLSIRYAYLPLSNYIPPRKFFFLLLNRNSRSMSSFRNSYFRFGWWFLPPVYSYAAAGVLLLSYVMWAVVLKQNAYLSRTIKVEEGQTVVDTGLYGIVRHPMYGATILLFLMRFATAFNLIDKLFFNLFPPF